MSMATVNKEYPPSWVNDNEFKPADQLIKLRGHNYLPVHARLRWFLRDQREMIASGAARQPYQIEIVGHMIDREQGWSRHHVRITDVLGNMVESTGSESQSDFIDYDEKSYTKALGRSLALLGYATGDALDFDEGPRVVDAPLDQRPHMAANSAPRPVAPSARPAPMAAPPRPAPAAPATEPQPAMSIAEPLAEQANTTPAQPILNAGSEMSANERQVASIRKLCAALHRTEPDFARLTFNDARTMLSELSRAYSEARRAG